MKKLLLAILMLFSFESFAGEPLVDDRHILPVSGMIGGILGGATTGWMIASSSAAAVASMAAAGTLPAGITAIPMGPAVATTAVVGGLIGYGVGAIATDAIYAKEDGTLDRMYQSGKQSLTDTANKAMQLAKDTTSKVVTGGEIARDKMYSVLGGKIQVQQ